MNSVRMIVLGVALLAGMGCVALLARGMASSKPRPVIVAVAPPSHPTVRVLVAKRDLLVGEHVGETDMAWQDWPAENVNPAYIVDGAGVSAPQSQVAVAAGKIADQAKDAMSNPAEGKGAQVLGSIVKERIMTGEPFMQAKLVHPGTAGVMAVTLEPGMRAMAVPLSAESAAGGFILPGDHVDVVLNRQVDSTSGPGVLAGGGKMFVASTIARNVRVLAIDQNTGPQKGDAVIGATATVEVAPDQAKALVLAKAVGQLTLILRSYADAAGPPMFGEDPQGRGSSADGVVRVYRPGSSTTVMVNR